ncbi:hypothetical protein IAR55_004619 [Kwoniella newhampshirensis]|uniref:Uncharacterized protein n=1 Tax=Kwoniella newhampshirensis TaxID=1651941 RepID=A0AAW0YK29_9TREE
MLPEERFVTPPPSTPELQEPSSNIVNGLPTPRKTPLEPVVNEWRISLPDKPLNSFQDGIIPLDDFDKCKAAPEIRAYFCLIARYLNNANNANGLSSMPITDYEVTQGWTYLRDCHKKCKDLYGDDDKLRRELDIDGPTPDWQGLFVNPPTKDIASPLNGVEHATEPVDSVELLSRLSKGRELFMNSSLHCRHNSALLML